MATGRCIERREPSWEKVDVTGFDECQQWQESTKHGGCSKIASGDRRSLLAHRVSLLLTNGHGA